MALICRESDDDCKKETRSYVVVNPVVRIGFAVSSHIIEGIPAGETYADPCRRYKEGLNVHLVEGSKGTFTPEGHFCVFNPGKFVFAVMRKTAEAHLPKTLACIDKAANRRTEEN